MNTFKFTISGMHCKSCVVLITDSLEELGAKQIKLIFDEKKQLGKLELEYSGNIQEIKKTIEKEGYHVL